jgi:hypothetical protein
VVTIPQPSAPQLVDLVTWRRAIRHPFGPKKAVVRHVLLTLSTWGDKDGGSMYPSIETLHIACRLHRETVRRALNDASKEGWVKRQNRTRPSGDAYRAYEYSASVPSNWKDWDDIDHPWDKDPSWNSERENRGVERAMRANRPHSGQGRVSPLRTGTGGSNGGVPVVDAGRPSPELAASLSRTVSVPVQDRLTSSGPPHRTSSREGRLTPTARESIDQQDRKQESESNRRAAARCKARE